MAHGASATLTNSLLTIGVRSDGSAHCAARKPRKPRNLSIAGATGRRDEKKAGKRGGEIGYF